MTPRQRNWIEVGLLIVAVLVALGGFYAFASGRDNELTALKGDIKRLEEHYLTLNKRLDRFEDKLDVLIERGKK